MDVCGYGYKTEQGWPSVNNSSESNEGYNRMCCIIIFTFMFFEIFHKKDFASNKMRNCMCNMYDRQRVSDINTKIAHTYK